MRISQTSRVGGAGLLARGPSLFGVLATRVDRSVALVSAAIPALLAALVPPSRDNRFKPHGPDRGGDAASV